MELRSSGTARESKVDETRLGFDKDVPLLDTVDKESSRSFRGFTTMHLLVCAFIIANIVLWVPLGLYVFSKNPDPSSSNSNTAVTDDQSTNDDQSSNQAQGSVVARTILPMDWPATGIRLDYDNNVIMTGGTGPPFTLQDNVTAYIYYGPIANIPNNSNSSSLHLFYPNFPNETVLGSMFYGPNSALFDSRCDLQNYFGHNISC